MSKPTVLVTAGHRGGANALLPVLKHLREDPELNVYALGYGQAVSAWQGAEDVHSVGENEEPSYETAFNVLNSLRPAAVLTGTGAKDEKHAESRVWDKQVVAAANALNIPSVAVLDAWMNYRVRFSDTDKNVDWCFMPTKIAVMDKFAYDGFVADKIPEQHLERLVVTGNPTHDGIARKAAAFSDVDRARVREHLGLAQDAPVLFYGAGWLEPELARYAKDGSPNTRFLGYTDRTVLDELIPELARLNAARAGENKPAAQLFIKMHPREQADYPARYAAHVEIAQKTHGIRTVLFEPPKHDAKTHPHDIILATDLFASPNSSLLGEAAMMGKPAVSTQFGRIAGATDYAAPFTDLGVVRRIENASELRPALEYALANPKAAGFQVSGNGTESVAHLVYSLLKK